VVVTLTSWDSEVVRREPLDEASNHLAELADEIDRDGERVLLTRPGHDDLVLMPADELASLTETVFWQRDEAVRAAAGEPPGDGEDGPGLDEAAVRQRFARLLHARDE
jgi:prevent-host-death family protein